uniref:Putative head tail connector protein n=1 Tax=viral metagenome TaxID=1070528 RepID=A0A6M3K0N4_9ZZZZ
MAKTKEPTQEQLEDFKKLQILTHEASLRKELNYVSFLGQLYTESAMYKQRISDKWEDYARFMRGDHWPGQRPKYKVSAVVNFIIENIERKTALLTDAKPIPKVVPRSDAFQNTADILNDLLSVIFEGSDFMLATADMIQNAQVYGSGFMSTLFDRSAEGGRGSVITPSIDPRAVYFDPLVLKSYLLAEGEYVIIEDVWSVSKAKDIYPKVADRIRPDSGITPYKTRQNTGMFSGIFSRIFRTRQDDAVIDTIPRVYVREYWMKDRSKTENNKPEFKNMSRKSVLIGDAVLADDGDNPYNDGSFPTDMIIWHSDPDSGWGWGDVELLTSPQEQFNKLLAIIIENATLMSNAIWIGDADALSKEDWNKLTNAPGKHVRIRPGRALRREAGVALPPYIFQIANFLKVAKDELTGMVDVMRGIRTGQVASGVGIESLQLAAQALVRLRARALESLHARMGRKLISRLFQFYTPERIFEVLKARSEKYDEQIKEIQSELLKKPTSRREDAWTDVTFTIEPGSNLQLERQQRKTEAMNLRKMQVIDDRALLEVLEYPHREEVIKRVEKKRQDAANQEIAAQQPASHAGASTQFPNQTGGSPAAG